MCRIERLTSGTEKVSAAVTCSLLFRFSPVGVADGNLVGCNLEEFIRDTKHCSVTIGKTYKLQWDG